eukprot:3951951-Ditylum_brightwellii.AAC.1
MHAGNVYLVLNPRIGHVSPQYHVVFDDSFSVVPHLQNSITPPLWCDLIGSNHVNLRGEILETTWDFPCAQDSQLQMVTWANNPSTNVSHPEPPLESAPTQVPANSPAMPLPSSAELSIGSNKGARGNSKQEIGNPKGDTTSKAPKMIDLLSTSGLR